MVYKADITKWAVILLCSFDLLTLLIQSFISRHEQNLAIGQAAIDYLRYPCNVAVALCANPWLVVIVFHLSRSPIILLCLPPVWRRNLDANIIKLPYGRNPTLHSEYNISPQSSFGVASNVRIRCCILCASWEKRHYDLACSSIYVGKPNCDWLWPFSLLAYQSSSIHGKCKNVTFNLGMITDTCTSNK
jgi:hypothetical protein